jgi:hypothetical protein
MKSEIGLKWAMSGLSVCMGLTLSGTALAAGIVTAEKNCNVRIEGDDYQVGDRVVVFKEVAGKQKRLAIVEIAKVSASQKALGRVVKGPTTCAVLKGASVELADAKGSIAKVSGAPGVRMDSQVGLGVSFLGYPSLAYPGKEVDKSVSRLRAPGFFGKFDIYPLAFFGTSVVERGIGFGFDFAYSSVFPPSEVAGSAGEVVGKLSTTLTDLRADAVFRVLYGKEKMSTELRISPYLSRNVVQSYSGEASADSPLANLSVQGMGVGVLQRLHLSETVSANILAIYGLSMRGTTVDAAGGASVPLSKASGLLVDVGVNYQMSKMKLYGLFRYEDFGGEGTSVDPETNAEAGYELRANKFLLSAGVGFAL